MRFCVELVIWQVKCISFIWRLRLLYTYCYNGIGNANENLMWILINLRGEGEKRIWNAETDGWCFLLLLFILRRNIKIWPTDTASYTKIKQTKNVIWSLKMYSKSLNILHILQKHVASWMEYQQDTVAMKYPVMNLMMLMGCLRWSGKLTSIVIGKKWNVKDVGRRELAHLYNHHVFKVC